MILPVTDMNTDVLRFARERKGLTQSQLAEAVHSHQSIISAIERGNQDLPARLLFQLCDVLELRPAALFNAVAPASPATDPAYIVKGRISHIFMGNRQRKLGEVFQFLLEELVVLRVDLIALTLHLFDRRPMAYAGAIAGQWGVTWREHVIEDPAGHLRDTRGGLYRGWREGTEVRKPGELCHMADYTPAIVIDLPIAQGMVGFGFARELPDLSAWARIVADAVCDGVSLLDEIGQVSAPNLAADVVVLKSRLDAVEARLRKSPPH
jgi:transcriptional regulator with XRE-family HTH domain